MCGLRIQISKRKSMEVRLVYEADGFLERERLYTL